MFKRIFELWESWSVNGMRFPFLHDPVTKKPSITLLFPYLTFALAFISVVLLHIWPSMIIASGTALMFWVIATVLYLIRKLNKAKIDLDDKSLELEGSGGTDANADDK